MLSRRSLIGSLISLVAAPAIVRVSSIMSVKAMEPDLFAVPSGGITREAIAQLLAFIKTQPAMVPDYQIMPLHLYEELRRGIF